MISLVIYRARSLSSATWSESDLHFATHPNGLESNDEARHGGDLRGQIEGPYQDDGLLEYDDQDLRSQADGQATSNAARQGPTVQPSRLHNEGDEWRDVPRGA